MAKTRIEKIADIDTQLEQLQNQRKEYLQAQKEADRKARDHRIIKRGVFIESVLPEIISFTDEQFKDFILKTLTTDFSKRELAKIAAQTVKPPDEKPSEPQTVVTQVVDANKQITNSQEKSS